MFINLFGQSCPQYFGPQSEARPGNRPADGTARRIHAAAGAATGGTARRAQLRTRHGRGSTGGLLCPLLLDRDPYRPRDRPFGIATLGPVLHGAGEGRRPQQQCRTHLPNLHDGRHRLQTRLRSGHWLEIFADATPGRDDFAFKTRQIWCDASGEFYRRRADRPTRISLREIRATYFHHAAAVARIERSEIRDSLSARYTGRGAIRHFRQGVWSESNAFAQSKRRERNSSVHAMVAPRPVGYARPAT